MSAYHSQRGQSLSPRTVNNPKPNFFGINKVFCFECDSKLALYCVL